MAGFLYFIPEQVEPPELEKLRAGGLAYAFEKSPTYREVKGAGPSGVPGMILAADAGEGTELIGFYPARQTWRKHPAGKAWVGYWNDHRPEPTDLQRRDLLTGHMVRLGDGHEWLIPCARRWVDQGGDLRWRNALPHALGVDDDGLWTRRTLLPEYNRLWAHTEKFYAVYESLADETPATMTDDEFMEATLAVLSANYRVAAIEVDMLGLLIETRVGDILISSIDVPTISEWVKKKQAVLPT